jgi:hypothetical protein
MTKQKQVAFKTAPKSMTIAKWCEAEDICPATFHVQQRTGNGPVTIKYPGSNVVRVIESRESYHERMAAKAATAAEKQARKRLLAQCRAAGKKAAEKKRAEAAAARNEQQR